jgi:undecaprenyl phosphate-alpha-L-ara4N flippase subunit ArnE
MNSWKENRSGAILMIVAALLSSLGQLLWKFSGGNINAYLIFGFMLYGMGALFMIVGLGKGSLTVLQPMMSISYIFALIWGYIFINEPITLVKIVGVLIILIGVVFISGGDKE